MTELEIRNLSFAFGDKTVFRDVNLKISDPGLYCILGPNGVGKTTLVKCINKLITPSSGSIRIDGKDVADMSILDMAGKVAFVPNGASSVFSMSVSDAILMGRHPHAGWMTSDDDVRAVDEVMDVLDLQQYADRDISELSSGQLQRVMIARGLVQEPEILILDEPTSNLDVRYQMDIMRFTKAYAKDKGVIVLMICHDVSLAAQYADSIILMQQGGIRATGCVSEVLTSDILSSVYGVNAKVMLMDGKPHVHMSEREGSGATDCSRIGRHRPTVKKSGSRGVKYKVVNIIVVALILAAALLSAFNFGSSGNSAGPGSLVGTEIAESGFPNGDSRLWVYGNANEDDYMDSEDLEVLRDMVSGKRESTVLADANCDGRVDYRDIEYLERIMDRENVDVYYIDNYFTVSKVSWPVDTIAIGYCSGAYLTDLTGLCGKVKMVDSTIKQFWYGMNSNYASADSYGTTESPDYERIMECGVDVYVPGYCDGNADQLSRDKLEPAGIDVMFMNTSDNSGVDYPNEYIDRSILMFSFLLQGDMDKTYDYLGWHDGVLNKLKDAAKTLSDEDKLPFMMSRSYPTDSSPTISVTGKNNTNNIHAEWVGVDAVGQHNPMLGSNYNKLTYENIYTVITEESEGRTFFYMDNEHDGMRHSVDLDKAIDADRQMLKDCGVTIHYLGMAREGGNSPLYVIEMAFYQNVMYPELSSMTGIDYRELFDYYFEHFASEDYRSLIDINDFFRDYGTA